MALTPDQERDLEEDNDRLRFDDGPDTDEVPDPEDWQDRDAMRRYPQHDRTWGKDQL